jgi:hypothetical protein
VPVTIGRNAGTGSGTLKLGPGDVRIANMDSTLDLALIGDSISSGLAEKAVAAAREKTDTAAVKGSGFGADIERMVKRTVQSALSTRVAYPLSAVRDVRYDGQRIVFEWNGKQQSFGKVNVNGKDMMETFSPADARRFVEAVRARKGSAAAQ